MAGQEFNIPFLLSHCFSVDISAFDVRLEGLEFESCLWCINFIYEVRSVYSPAVGRIVLLLTFKQVLNTIQDKHRKNATSTFLGVTVWENETGSVGSSFDHFSR